jgi:hypothetical protein
VGAILAVAAWTRVRTAQPSEPSHIALSLALATRHQAINRSSAFTALRVIGGPGADFHRISLSQGKFFEQRLIPRAGVLRRDGTRSWSFVEIRNSFGIIGQTNQTNSTHDHRPTNYNSKSYDRRIYDSWRGEEGPYPDNNADDTKTHPDYDFHGGSVLVSLAKGEPGARDRRCRRGGGGCACRLLWITPTPWWGSTAPI